MARFCSGNRIYGTRLSTITIPTVLAIKPARLISTIADTRGKVRTKSSDKKEKEGGEEREKKEKKEEKTRRFSKNLKSGLKVGASSCILRVTGEIHWYY